jgi:MerR family mercuric resistance operon transcriptional regulator
MPNELENLTIEACAKEAGVSVWTIRFYERNNLLRKDASESSSGGYDEMDIERARFVKNAQRLGFSLGEVAELLRLADGTHYQEANCLAVDKLASVREKQSELARFELALSELVATCGSEADRVSCPLIPLIKGVGREFPVFNP